MDSILAALGLKKGALISGLAGALVSYRFFRDLPLEDRAITIACGLPAALYVGPLISEALGMSERSEMGITFLTGALGISVLSAAVKSMPEIITAAKEYFFTRKS